MKIECKIKRASGSLVKIDKETYNFLPDDKGVHCCEVSNKAHIKKLLSIKEAYKEYGKAEVKPKPDDSAGKDALDPEKMNNDALNKWAKERNFNPLSKPSILDYAAEHYEPLDVAENVGPASMVRMIVKMELAEQE